MDEVTRTNDITTTVSLQRLIEAKGLKLKKHGNQLQGRCPFHTSKADTLTIDTKANTWSCNGKCRTRNADVIQWVMKSEGVSRKHALELLAKDFSTKQRKAKTARKLDSFVATEEPDHLVLDRVVAFYGDTLKQSPDALGYLQQRRLVHGELLDHFNLGYANRTLGYRLPPRNRKLGATLRNQLERIGLYRSSGHEHFAGSLVVPILNERGVVTQMYGRKVLDKRLRPGTPQHLWLPGPINSVFNPLALAASTEVVVTDSVINAITFWVAGIRNVTVAISPQYFMERLLPALQTAGVTRVMLATRRTKEGEQQAQSFGDEASAVGLEVFRVVLPNGMDANDLARSVEQPSDALQQAVRSAVWVSGTARAVVNTTTAAEPAALVEAPTTTTTDDNYQDEVVLRFGDRRWRVRGLQRNISFEQLKVNLLVGRDNGSPLGHGFHVDTLELYSARQRTAFIRQAADELGVDETTIKHDIGKVLLELERLQDKQIKEALEPKVKPVEMSDGDRKAALNLLRDPALVERIVDAFNDIGLIGEATNKLTAYLAATSRKLPDPLAVVIQSSSAAGKSSLLDRVLDFIPEEDRSHFSAMTGQSLYYLGESELSHKVLAVAEEAGAHRASYALKLLQSDGSLTIASTGKDPGTGRLVTQEYSVRGPVALMFTTTSIDLDPELANRCVVLTVDEGREQTAAIHRVQRQRQTLEGLLAGHDRDELIKIHQNAQRLLRPINIVNPFASELAFNDGQTRSRRDHQKYLTLIKTITLLHQHQRTTKTIEHRGHRLEYIEATNADVELANKIAAEVLFNLGEIPPQTMKLLEQITAVIKAAATTDDIELSKVRLTRRQLRQQLGISNTALRLHLARLVELEHLVEDRGPRRVRLYGLADDLATWRALGTPIPRQVEANDSAPLSSLGGVSETARPGKRPKSPSYTQAGK